jgi:3' exoribonuclease, RNase T-like
MRYFVDTEFVTDGRTIELLSVGLVCEDGREFYAQSSEGRSVADGDPWIRENVIPQFDEHSWMTPLEIRRALVEFVGDDRPQWWGYFASFDLVVLCQLFGGMMELPDRWPMVIHDLEQLRIHLGVGALPEQKSGMHNALADARWNREVYHFLRGEMNNK